MKIDSLYLKNFRAFAEININSFGNLTTIVGKNDVGKSSILHALKVFFSKPTKVDKNDVFFSAQGTDAEVIIEIGFTNLPTHDDVSIFEKLGINEDAFCMRLTYNSKTYKKAKTEYQLNQDYHKISSEDLKDLDDFLPKLQLFEAENKLGIGETTFQNQFNPIILAAIENPEFEGTREQFETKILDSLKSEVDTISQIMNQYADTISNVDIEPTFKWDKAVTFDVQVLDEQGNNLSLDKRGTGVRRLFMVSFFQYLTQREIDPNKSFIFAIEEPENSLHPGLQRELANAFDELASEHFQLIITSHAPIFAERVNKENLVLIEREQGVTKALQYPNLTLEKIVDELGIKSSDAIIGASACVLVEGKDDHDFLQIASEKFKEQGLISQTPSEKNIVFMIGGGSTIKHWVELQTIKKISRHFILIIDSDKEDEYATVDKNKIKLKEICIDSGGKFHMLHKRAIENYLHINALKQAFPHEQLEEFDDFTDMKNKYTAKILQKVVGNMTSDLILDRDKYLDENGNEHHEILELIQEILALAN